MVDDPVDQLLLQLSLRGTVTVQCPCDQPVGQRLVLPLDDPPLLEKQRETNRKRFRVEEEGLGGLDLVVVHHVEGVQLVDVGYVQFRIVVFFVVEHQLDRPAHGILDTVGLVEDCPVLEQVLD